MGTVRLVKDAQRLFSNYTIEGWKENRNEKGFHRKINTN